MFFFTVRRTDKYWCGIPADQGIETGVMKVFKDPRVGLTHGKGTDESDIAKWILSLPIFIEILESFQNYCSISFETSEQHKSATHQDGTNSRIKKDNEDNKTLLSWFDDHPPFGESDKIIYLSSGIVGDKRVNCFEAFDKGFEGIKSVMGMKLSDVKISRKLSVSPLSIMPSKIKLYEKDVPIDPGLIFQRIFLAKQTDDELRDNFRHELAPYPLSLFDETGMRKNVKSDLYAFFEPDAEPTSTVNTIYVVDGGWLLHKVVWGINLTFHVIAKKYLDYIISNFGRNCVIIFDGYSYDLSTKNTERLRRLQRLRCPDIKVTANGKANVSQEKFLSNSSNKESLITLICELLESEKIENQICNDDADVDIVKMAISKKKVSNEVVIVGEDTDLLVILTELASSIKEKIYIRKQVKKNEQMFLFYTQYSFIYPHLIQYILFIHAFSGCDATSSFFKRGKKSVVESFQKYLTAISSEMLTFYKPNASKSALRNAGETCVKAVYGFDPVKHIELNVMRFTLFQKLVNTKRSIACNLCSLPPTSDSLYHHSLRVYFQVQTWLGRGDLLNPVDYGWKKSENGLMPITTKEKLIPDNLISILKCSCRKGCKSNKCSCRSNDKKCSALCQYCKGMNCSNAPSEIILEEEEDEANNADIESDIEITSNINEGSVYTSTDYFESGTSADCASESDDGILDSTIYEPVCEIDEDVYDSDDEREDSDFNETGPTKKRKAMN